ncbi:MAG: hypothetical protein JXA64_07320 [Candidatus Fermentibacteraceae bacterium]|nr:hypothetical protein [Candidatus Fermentibacteraceae bacterium]MBN2608910.1 hypothetical protein [Candidatus Fermentibacteraceae bacterium]
MSFNSGMVPVLQMADLDALEDAQEYLGRNGYRTKVTPFEDLPESEYQDWMIPEDSGYLLWLESSEYEPAMDILSEFFGNVDALDDEEVDFYPDEDY